MPKRNQVRRKLSLSDQFQQIVHQAQQSVLGHQSNTTMPNMSDRSASEQAALEDIVKTQLAQCLCPYSRDSFCLQRESQITTQLEDNNQRFNDINDRLQNLNLNNATDEIRRASLHFNPLLGIRPPSLFSGSLDSQKISKIENDIKKIRCSIVTNKGMQNSLLYRQRMPTQQYENRPKCEICGQTNHGTQQCKSPCQHCRWTGHRTNACRMSRARGHGDMFRYNYSYVNSQENQMDVNHRQEPPRNLEVVIKQKSVDSLTEALKSLEVDSEGSAAGEAKSTLKKHLMAIKSAMEKLSIQGMWISEIKIHKSPVGINMINQLALNHIKSKVEESQKKYKEMYDHSQKNVSYKLGDLVLKESEIVKKGRIKKLQSIFEGPFKILDVTYPNIRIEKKRMRNGIETIHVNHSKPFYKRADQEHWMPDPNIDEEGSDGDLIPIRSSDYSVQDKQRQKDKDKDKDE
uniref:Uncharacterized protein n=1 Tax=Romanomermis culicivorax TaxID=13658 RepID=A0A915KRK8_ROMCU